MPLRSNTGATGTAPVGHRSSRVKSFASFFSKNKKLNTKDLKMESVHHYDITYEDMKNWLLGRFDTVPPELLKLMKDNDLYTFWIPKDDSLGPEDLAAVEGLRQAA